MKWSSFWPLRCIQTYLPFLRPYINCFIFGHSQSQPWSSYIKLVSVILLLPVILGELMSCLTYPAKKIKALVSQRLLDLGDTLLKRTLLNIWKTVYKCLGFFVKSSWKCCLLAAILLSLIFDTTLTPAICTVTVTFIQQLNHRSTHIL